MYEIQYTWISFDGNFIIFDPIQYKIFTGTGTGTSEKFLPGPGRDRDQRKIFTGTGTGTKKLLPGPGRDRDQKKVILQFPNEGKNNEKKVMGWWK